MRTEVPVSVEFAYQQTLILGGGESNYSDSSKSAIWSEILNNREIRGLAFGYLMGDSRKASENLERLNKKLTETFLVRS
jgi:hypothetical protein